MKVKLAGWVLILLAGSAWGQTGGLMNAEVSEMTSITDPSQAAQDLNDQWLAFSMPVLKGTRSPCCWNGRWNQPGSEFGCSLEWKHQSYGTRSDTPRTDKVIAYARIRKGRISALRVVGPQCPVEADGAKVVWLGTVDDTASLDWLEDIARSEEEDPAETALYALALHRSNEVTNRLHKLAVEPNGDLAEEAMFWLGSSRGDAGTRMLLDLAMDKTRPREVRRQALFWLAHSDNDEAVAALVELLTR